MDTLTHAISGAVIGLASGRDPGSLRRRAVWGTLFAAFPDIDIVMVLFTDHFTYLNEHRGLTHSVILLPAWAAVLGWLAKRVSGLRLRDGAALAAASLAAHILGDLITSYGTRVFMPVHDAPLAFPITFIIDPIFTLILLVGAVVALRRRAARAAAASLVVLCAYLVLQVVAQSWATRIGIEHAQSLGVPDAPVIAFPQPLSPFNWKVVVAEGGNYHRAYVNLLLDEPRPRPEADANRVSRLRAAYRPPGALNWKTYPRWPRDPEYRAVATAAWRQPGFAGFREFALLPYVTSIRGDERKLCVWFTDMRFTLPIRPAPFEYAMCRRNGTWALALDARK